MVTLRFETDRSHSRRNDFSHVRLAGVESFKGLSVSFMEAFIGELEIRVFSKGDIIMQEGTVGSDMMFLLHGAVDVVRQAEKIATLGEGSIFGEMGCLGLSNKRTCTVIATELCDCRCISAWHFKALLKVFPEAQAHFERIAEERQAQKKEWRRSEKIRSWIVRSRRRGSKERVDLVTGSKEVVVPVHLKRLTPKGLSTPRRGRSKNRASMTADLSSWGSDLTTIQIAAQESPAADCPENLGSVARSDTIEDEDEDTTGADFEVSLCMAPVCHKPLCAPIAKCGTRFRTARWSKQVLDHSVESADTTAASSRRTSRSASIDLSNAPSEDLCLPRLPEPKFTVPTEADTAHSLRDAMLAQNAVLRRQLLKTREDLVQRCHSSKQGHGIDRAAAGLLLSFHDITPNA